MKIKTNDFVISMGKPALVVDVYTSSSGEQAYLKLLSADLIARNGVVSGGELVDIGYHITPCEKDVLINSVSSYVRLLESKIKELAEFKQKIEGM